MLIQPYLLFDGRCEEAIEFYRQATGAEVVMKMHYRDSPDPMPPGTAPGYENKVMHANLSIGESTVLMADDCMGHPNFQGFSLAMTVDTPAEAEKRFAALAVGGQVMMPLTKTFWSPSFGMLADRFGVHWMVMVR